MKSINSLPDELLAKLFHLVDFPSRFTLEIVCKRWKYISDIYCKNVGIIQFELYVQQMGIDSNIFSKLLQLVMVRRMKIEGIIVSDETSNDFNQLIELVDFILSSPFVCEFKIFKYQNTGNYRTHFDRLCNLISNADHLCVLELCGFEGIGPLLGSEAYEGIISPELPYQVNCSKLLYLNTAKFNAVLPCNLKLQNLKTLEMSNIDNHAANFSNLPVFEYENGIALLSSLETFKLKDFDVHYIDNDKNNPEIPRLQMPSLNTLELSCVDVKYEIDLTHCFSLESLVLCDRYYDTKIINLSNCQPKLTSLVIGHLPEDLHCCQLTELIEFGMLSNVEVNHCRVNAEQTNLILLSLCNKARLLQSVVLDVDVQLHPTMLAKLITCAWQLDSLALRRFTVELLLACFESRSLATLTVMRIVQDPDVFKQLFEKLILSGVSRRREQLTLTTVKRGGSNPSPHLVVPSMIRQQLRDRFNFFVQNSSLEARQLCVM